MILGIDEVGRGPWAGPLLVVACVLNSEIEGLNDSKKLTKKRREELAREIYAKSNLGFGWVSARELDGLGMSDALKLATRRAVQQIKCPYSEIIIDGTINFLSGTKKGEYAVTMKKADGLIPSVSAASIVAKVARDDYMQKMAEMYPEYGFDSNAGYGTAKHIAAIEKFGVTPIHRLSFKPLLRFRESFSDDASEEKTAITTKSLGDKAEDLVANWLEREGHRVVARNWRTKWCEIDIVSVLDDKVYFTEVKYRKNNDFGGGFAAIDGKKQHQIRFAAEMFLNYYPEAQKFEVRLLGVNVFGNAEDFNQIEVVEI